jgi:putative transposase
MGLNPSPSGETLPLGSSFYYKGKSLGKLLMEFKHLQKAYWGRRLWARGYFVASSGNVTDEVIQVYIRQQEGTEPDDGDDNFRITKS